MEYFRKTNEMLSNKTKILLLEKEIEKLKEIQKLDTEFINKLIELLLIYIDSENSISVDIENQNTKTISDLFKLKQKYILSTISTQ